MISSFNLRHKTYEVSTGSDIGSLNWVPGIFSAKDVVPGNYKEKIQELFRHVCEAQEGD